MSLPKKKISEIKALLKREPKIRVIYVEGIFDRNLYQWILQHLGLQDIKVYPISTVEIPDDYLKNQGLTNGERQRVQAAAREFITDAMLHKQILFLIDADLDYLLDQANYVPPLRSTAGTSAELIMWRKEVLRKFFSIALKCENPDKTVDDVMAFVEPIVSAVCEFRAAKERLGANWDLIDISDTFSRKSAFSFDVFCAKVADKNAARKQIHEQLPPVLAEIRERAKILDIGQKMHGHDLFSALARKLKIDGFEENCLKDFEELGRLLMTSLEWAFIKDDKTVSQLTAVFEAQNV